METMATAAGLSSFYSSVAADSEMTAVVAAEAEAMTAAANPLST